MTKVIKMFISIIVLFVSFTFISIVSFGEDDKELSELYNEISKTEQFIGYDVKWTNIIAETQTTKPVGNEAGYGSNKPVLANTWYGQQINMLEVPREIGKDGKVKYEVVAWSIQGNQQWDFAGVTKMAADFEQKNPDYMVLGGINGDFYDWHTTFDYPNSGNGVEMSNGEFLRSVNREWGVVGIRNTIGEDQLVFAPRSNNLVISDSFYLTIYDESGEEIKCIELNGINNSNLEEGQTSAYFGNLERVYAYDEHGNHILNSYDEWTITERIYHAPILADGNTYIVKDGEKVIYQAAENSYYGKGIITNVNEGKDVPKNSFAIVTKDSEVDTLLKKGLKIRVQRQFVGEFSGVENALGCSHPLIEDGVFSPYYVSEDYYTTRAPRTIIGAKEDGTICLLTMDGRNAKENYYGTNQEEINVILEQLEITDAYLLDGGGSSTFFVRENNKFVVKNVPSDGNQRSVSNGFLIVTKVDKTIETKEITTTNNSVTIETKISDNDITNAFVEINEQRYPIVNNRVTINNLDSNTSYNFTYYYLQNDNLISCTYFETFKTDKLKPNVSINRSNVEDGKLFLDLEVDDPEDAVYVITCEINGKRTVYPYDTLEENEVFEIKLPKDIDSFVCNITISYQLNTYKPIEKYNLEYNYEGTGQTDDSNNSTNGCGSFGYYYISTLIVAGSILLLIKKRK